jgi:8-oxo-dGTP diphosphatase
VASALQPPGVPFVVLRHGKAVKRNAWHKADVDRPLDRSGRRQSKALIALLDTYGIRQVHTSSATRCVETVVPFATSSGLPVEPEPGLTEEGFDADPGGGLARAGELMARAAAAEVPTVVCGHRPVMPAMLAHLLEGSGLVGPTETIPTASFLVLHLVDGRPVALEHHLTD